MNKHKQVIHKEFNFVGIGQAKSGTSALWFYLGQHPDVFWVKDGPRRWGGIAMNGVPWVGLEVKEPNFFNTDPEKFVVHVKKYGTWIEQINSSPDDKLIGEFTVHYMDDIQTLRNIKEHSPNAKILAILRNPIDRCYSEVNWFYGNTEKTEEQFKLVFNSEHMIKRFIGKSLYAKKIQNCFEVFNRDQVMFIKYEDFKQDNEKTVREVFNFLGLDNSKYEYKEHKVLLRDYFRPMSDTERSTIQRRSLDDIRKTEELLGWDCSDWYK